MNSYTFSYMFWTDSGQNKLYRSHMDGTNIKTIMDGCVSASGITADYEGEYTSSTLTLRMYDVYTHSQVFYECFNGCYIFVFKFKNTLIVVCLVLFFIYSNVIHEVYLSPIYLTY